MPRGPRRRRVCACETPNRSAIRLGAALAAMLLATAWPASGDALERPDEPVVLSGEGLPGLVGRDPAVLVGFRWNGASFDPIPVQVDERAVVEWGRVYGCPPYHPERPVHVYCDALEGVSVLTYTDPGTFTGPDPDPAFDEDDEIVFLAGSAGTEAPAGADPPSDVVATSRHDVRLRQSESGAIAWVYLFESDGSRDPGAGASAIDYRFDLLSGSYEATYDVVVGPNPEDSVVTTSAYTVGFTDRWVRDRTGVSDGGASAIDLLDRHRFLFRPGECGRSEDTFSEGEGAFLVNRTGPVRALRGYAGANSGPLTTRVHRFYERREIVETDLRVHPIDGAMDFLDWAPAASGAVYASSVVPEGVPVDGEPDVVPSKVPDWEVQTGEGGTVAQVHRFVTDVPALSERWYYRDDRTPPEAQCTGDAFEYAASGPWVDGEIPNTDPRLEGLGGVFRLTSRRALAYGPPSAGQALAVDLAAEVDRPLEVQVHGPNGASCPDADADGFESSACNSSPSEGGGDCDDSDPGVRPGATETCDGVDQDCDGAYDEGLPTTTWYGDGDGDGYGDPASSVTTCDPASPAGTVGNDEDCDDTSAAVSPAASEDCANGTDDDCDGAVDEADLDCPPDCGDEDGDGYDACDPASSSAEQDCDDTDAAVYPGAPEVCSAEDENCNGVIDDPSCERYDATGDGYVDGYELTRLAWWFGACSDTPDTEPWYGVDFDRSGCVDPNDLTLLGNVWGLACVAGTLACP